VVVAAWTLAWPAGQKRLDYGRRHIFQMDHSALAQVAIEQV